MARQIYYKVKEIKLKEEKYNRRKIVARPNYVNRIYYLCQQNIFTKWYINNISKGFQILYPGDYQYIIYQTIKTTLLLWGLSLILIVLIFSYFKSFYLVWTVSFYIIVIHIELVGSSIRSQEIKLLTEFENYLTEIRYYYYISNMVEESLEYAIERESKEMRIHAVKIYNIISSNDPDKGFHDYNDTGPNKYIRLFLALSMKVIEYGDQIVDGKSLYLSNINHLKNDIHIELLKVKSTKFAFATLSFITVIPIIFLIPIRNWGVANIPELVNFYDYSNGKLLAVLIYIITLIAYFMLIHLKDISPIIISKNYILTYINRNNLISKLLGNYINKNYTKVLGLAETLKESGQPINISLFILKRFIYALLAFVISLLYFIYLNKLEGQSPLYWYQIVLSFILAIGAYLYPYLMVRYKRNIMKMHMEDEVIQFQSIIMMVKSMERISTFNILEFMEDFATIFKDSIHTCINDFDSGDIKALEELRDKESFEPFRRIVGGLIISDKIGIDKAFDEISTDQAFYQDKRKADNAEILSTKAVIGKLIAYTPALITIGLYLIVPFISESLGQLSEFTKDFNLY
ncbi:MAG: hypothetical protein GX995_05945 [Clostridiales bacterium]|nr:hypothetical protein [Clostridiales bacterium]